MLDALKKPGCALCSLLKSRVDRHLEDLLYENVTDPGFRETFRSDSGFCREHTGLLFASRDGTAIALTHRDLLEDALQTIQSNRKLPLVDQRTKPCLLCRYARETDERHLKILRDYLEDPELKKQLKDSDGFCVPHYQALRRAAPSVPSWLETFQRQKYEELLSRLERYLDHENVKPGSKPPSLSEKDKKVWIETIKILFSPRQ